MKRRDIDVVLLCGGKGTRMYPLTREIPKPLIKIGDFPIIEHIIRHYAHFGFRKFKILTGYLGNVLHEYFKKHKISNLNIKCIDTGEDSGTAERLWQVKDRVSEVFFWNYGDDIGDVNLDQEFKFHKKKGKLATITLAPLAVPYGVVKFNENFISSSFLEKPVLYDCFINAGFFIMEKKIFDFWDLSDPDISKIILPKLAKLGELSCFVHKGFWSGVDTVRDYQILTELWEKNQATWVTWMKKGNLK